MAFFQLSQIEATFKMLHSSPTTVVEEPQPRSPKPTIPLSSPPPDHINFEQETILQTNDERHDSNSSKDTGDSRVYFDSSEDPARLPERISSRNHEQMETTQHPTTPPLTNEGFTPTASPQTPITPRYKQDLQYGGRNFPMSPLLELSKDPLFIPSPSKEKSGNTSWSQDFQILSPISQRQDPISRPVAVSMFRILNDKTQTVRPNTSKSHETSTITKSAPSPSCILRSHNVFEARDFRGLTVTDPIGRRAWWCRFDNLVVFDGMSVDPTTNSLKPITRTSKGLAFANRMGEEVIIILDVECSHCREILGLRLWKYKARVCKRGVCALCKAMCRQEWARLSNAEPLEKHNEFAEVEGKYIITL